MSRGWKVERGWEDGCVRRITRLIGNWERRSLIVGSGRRGGGRAGRMEVAIESVARNNMSERLPDGVGYICMYSIALQGKRSTFRTWFEAYNSLLLL